MSKHTERSAAAEKTVEQLSVERRFGNLSKLVLITVPAAAIALAFVIVVINGGDYASLLDALLLIAGGVGAGVTASATTYFGRSQTQLDLAAQRAGQTVAVATESALTVDALPADSPLLQGQWEPAVGQASLEPDQEVSPWINRSVVDASS